MIKNDENSIKINQFVTITISYNNFFNLFKSVMTLLKNT